MRQAAHRLLRGLSLTLLSGIAAAAVAQTTPASLPAPTSDKPIKCVDAMYRFLPGETNFCIAARDVQLGRYASALEMLQLAAGWGNKKAQYVLGVMYFNGEHVAADRSLGLAWLALAAERHDPTYEAVLVSAHGKATRVERQRASAQLAVMRPRYADATAARRAERHFDRGMRELTRDAVYGGSVCIDGLNGGHVDMKNPVCPSIASAVEQIQTAAAAYFDGWYGQVVVGPLQQGGPAGAKLVPLGELQP